MQWSIQISKCLFYSICIKLPANHTVTYLKYFLIQDSGAKHSNALCVDDGLVTSAERPGHFLLTVHNDGDTLLLHTDSYTMPSMQHKNNTHKKLLYLLCFSDYSTVSRVL